MWFTFSCSRPMNSSSICRDMILFSDLLQEEKKKVFYLEERYLFFIDDKRK